MQRLFIEPMDVWMFRDGRPFDAGSQHRAVSLFPPPPTVVQGALRANHLIRMKNVDLRKSIRHQVEAFKAIGYADENYGQFRMIGPFVAMQDQESRLWRYFPQPADAVNVKGVYQPCIPRDEPGIETKLPDKHLKLLWPPEGAQPEKVAGVNWWREDALRSYLADAQVAATHLGIILESALVTHDSRIGIDYDDALGTSAEGMLYEADFIRPREGVGLDVEVTDELLTPWPTLGTMTIGGEMRAAQYRKLDQPADPIPRNFNNEHFKLYFATPAFFEAGWQPKNGDWSHLLGPGVECVGAAIGRALIVGGYDLAKRQHKPSRRYVPAGSVYYFKGTVSSPKDNITQWGAEIGFGYYFTGGWK